MFDCPVKIESGDETCGMSSGGFLCRWEGTLCRKKWAVSKMASSSGRTERQRHAAADTMRILKDGFYRLGSGIRVSIRTVMEEAYKGTTHIAPEDFDGIWKSIEARGEESRVASTVFLVENKTTFAAARAILDAGAKEVACMNFASATVPGGPGLMDGTGSQEQALARASGLYSTLVKFDGEFYDMHRREQSSLYSDNMVYSPNVPFFRDDAGNLLTAPLLISVVTSAAVNRGSLRPSEVLVADDVMKLRIERILSLMAFYGHKHIVLGAFGCGIFGNSPSFVAQCFAKLLLPEGQFHSHFQKVSFAILDFTPNRSSITPFKESFTIPDTAT